MGWIIVILLIKIINILFNFLFYGYEFLFMWFSKNLYFEMIRMESFFFVCSVELLQKYWQMLVFFLVIFLIISVLVKLFVYFWWILFFDFYIFRQYSVLGGFLLVLILYFIFKLCFFFILMFLFEWMIGQFWVDIIKMI